MNSILYVENHENFLIILLRSLPKITEYVFYVNIASSFKINSLLVEISLDFLIFQSINIIKKQSMNPATYRSYQSINFSTNQSFIDINQSVKTQSKLLTFHQENIPKQIQIYKWRKQTQFPIVKVRNFEIVPNELNEKTNGSYKKIKVQFDSQLLCFSDIEEIPLFKILYLLKQSLIGFERLYSKFGSFLVNEQMVFIDREGKCKVWFSHQIYSNDIVSTKQKQTQFLNHVFTFFKNRTVSSISSNTFFETIKGSHSFFNALEIIQSFAEKQKIKISLNYKLSDSLKGSGSLQKKKKKVNLNLTMTKKPSFLKNLQLQNKKNNVEQIQVPIKSQSSIKLLPIKPLFNRPPMKISGDTAAESIKNSLQIRPPLKRFEPKLWKGSQQIQILISGEQKNSKLKCERKFSNNLQNRQNPQMHNQLFSSNRYVRKNQIVGQIAQSMIFDDKQSISHSDSSEQDMPLQKKKQLFNTNGWSLRVDSLFECKTQQKKSYIKKDTLSLTVKQPIKLDLLDKCTVNMCQSFMSDHSKN